MFRIKICGITNVEDATAAVDAGADAIGLNFYDKSPRFVANSEAARIAGFVRGFCATEKRPGGPIAIVAVVVNKPLEEIRALMDRKSGWLKVFQLHGDEPPSVMPYFGKTMSSPLPTTDWRLIRARRFNDDGVAAIAHDLDACASAGRRPDAVLVDALSPNRYGGTGETVSWVGLADHKKWLGDTPLILAGGLTPDNVAEAIRIVRPAAVDVASGVESAPGKKDPHKVRDFIAAAKTAFESYR
jgi:phosphoribosylanthranilate isomerase